MARPTFFQSLRRSTDRLRETDVTDSDVTDTDVDTVDEVDDVDEPDADSADNETTGLAADKQDADEK